MRVLVTGAGGFVGPWLMRELASAGHEPIAAPPSAELDIADVEGISDLVRTTRPSAIAHLAGRATVGDAVQEDIAAIRTHVGGAVAVVEAARRAPTPPALLVVSSAEVYGLPGASGTLRESDPTVPRSLYGLLKLAAESVAITGATRADLRLSVVRSFPHVGPGQRSVSAVASFAARVAAVRLGEATTVAVGNLDVERDIGDVRDYVRAYRLMLERMDGEDPGRTPEIFNLATGGGVSLRAVLGELCRLAGVDPEIRIDPELTRPDDPARIVGDASRLVATIGWQPTRPLDETLADILAEHLPRP